RNWDIAFRNPGLMRIPLEDVIVGGNTDCRNRLLHQMFLLVGLGGTGRLWHAEDFQRVAISQLATAQAMGERLFATNLAGAFLGKPDPR
ncbi:hypothetical protein, partial [Aeromonas aquatica]|uniref:hypothetical protein n=1 Tax=Aeromonas aquatica TaxID=558964 RepID=UPI001EE718EC